MDTEIFRERVLTVTWEDPKISSRDAAVINGLDYLRSLKNGEIEPPPAAKLIGYRISEIEKGRAVFKLYRPFRPASVVRPWRSR